MKDSNVRKTTQGEAKMLRYIEDLIRNRQFKRLLKKLKASRTESPSGMYTEWTPEQQKEHDYINRELGSIINGYETLRRRCKKIFKGSGFETQRQIADFYRLDNYLIALAEVMADNDDKNREWAMSFAEPDMCKIENIYDETMSPSNKGDENIYLRIDRQLRYISYPIAVIINPKASKRDVLDFIEKKWKWIESRLRDYSYDERPGPLRMRKRKHPQKMLDFIWANRLFTSEEIKAELDKQFPENGLVYYEINKIIQLEKERRFGNLT